MTISNNVTNNNNVNHSNNHSLTAKIGRLGAYTLTAITGCVVFPIALAVNLLAMPYLWLTSQGPSKYVDGIPGAIACLFTFGICNQIFEKLTKSSQCN